MTKRHFVRAAKLVNSIRTGEWTHDAPDWVEDTPDDDDEPLYDAAWGDIESIDYTRAVQTAEAFILLFREFNPRFDRDEFLRACGLTRE